MRTTQLQARPSQLRAAAVPQAIAAAAWMQPQEKEEHNSRSRSSSNRRRWHRLVLVELVELPQGWSLASP
jgi:hypothetical protein